MSKGEFQNLSGSGKPLKLEQELYVGRCNVCDQNQNHSFLEKDSEDVLLACVTTAPPKKKKNEREIVLLLYEEGMLTGIENPYFTGDQNV